MMETDNIRLLVAFLTKKDWSIILYPELHDVGVIPVGISNVNKNFVAFLQNIQSCVNSSETCWFNCCENFDGTSDSAFSWNEWELISIENAHSTEDIGDVKRFWANHIPIINIVQPHYSYIALRLSDNAVVFGEEPMFEETILLSSSFEGFIFDVINSNLEHRVQSILYD